jgi:glyoxylase-like metal-dependent hydrolase (beta-lactamase superfamily II)
MSDYTGEVAVGGPADVRRLPALQITKVAVGPMNNNAYLLRCARTGDVLLIDAAAEPDRLLSELGDAPLRAVVTTHRHSDHVQALAAVVERTGARTVAHPLDAPELPVRVDDTVDDGQTVAVGEVALQVVHLRGHTPGSIALRYDDPDGHPHLFTGDSLFPGGVGNTAGNAANFGTLIDDVEHKLFDRLPDATWVYPGHGKDTTLGAERPSLPEWRSRGW